MEASGARARVRRKREAARRGAVAALVADEVDADLPQVRVADTTLALAALARGSVKALP